MDIPKFNVDISDGIQTLISWCKIKQARRTDSEGTSKSTTAYPTRLFQSLTIFVSSIFSVCFSVYKHVEYLHHKLPLHNSFNIKIQVCTYIRCNTKHCSKNDVWPLTISSVNVTKSAGNCGFGQIYWVTFTKELFNGKLHAFWKWK